MPDCQHENIVTYHFSDTNHESYGEVALWACGDCHLRFAPELKTQLRGEAKAGHECGIDAKEEGFDSMHDGEWNIDCLHPKCVEARGKHD